MERLLSGRHEIKTRLELRELKFEKLARITNWPRGKLDAIAYSAPQVSLGGPDCWDIPFCCKILG